MSRRVPPSSFVLLVTGPDGCLADGTPAPAEVGLVCTPAREPGGLEVLRIQDAVAIALELQVGDTISRDDLARRIRAVNRPPAFARLQDLGDTERQVAANALQRGEPVRIQLDERGIFLHITPCPQYEVDFVCVERKRWGQGVKPYGMSREEHAVLQRWAATNIPALCRAWHQLGPMES